MLSPVPGPRFHLVPLVFFLKRHFCWRVTFLLFLLSFRSSRLFVWSTHLTALSGTVKSSLERRAPLWCFAPFRGRRLSEPVCSQTRQSSASLKSWCRFDIGANQSFSSFLPRFCVSQVRSLFSSALRMLCWWICKWLHKYADNSASTIIPDDKESGTRWDETHSSVHFLQRDTFSSHNSREKQTFAGCSCG